MRLEHYGVKGMKWGVRRKRGKGGLVSKDYAESRRLLKKGQVRLSNEDIKKVNKRLNLEAEMTRLDPTAAGTGKRLVGDFIKRYGKAIVVGASAAAGSATIKYVSKAVTK